jgi:tRNA pseudouridine synthase 10
MGERNTMPGHVEEITSTAQRVLGKYPLCDHCLGRIFAKHGLDLHNYERGFSIKTLLQMKLHRMWVEKKISCEELRLYAENAGDPITRLYERLCNERVEAKQCFICGNKLSPRYFEETAKRVADLLDKYNVSRFLLGVSIPMDISLREIEVYRESSIEASESIKNEIKREVGKIVRDKYGFTPDFDNPEAMVIIDYVTDQLKIIINPILLEGRYWKRGRNISHTPWITRDRGRLYPYSLQQFFNDSLREVYDAEEVLIHASGREDVDARMLGTGRPLVIEVKRPRFRLVDLSLVNELLESDLIEARVSGYSSRARIEYLKGEGSKKAKVYKLLVYSERSLGRDDLRMLEEEMRDRVIKQRTPTRILRRKKDRLRIRHVYEVRNRLITPNVFETIIYCDGGLYVKELVHGDNGRTTPSYAEILETRLYPLEIDVLGVELP